MRFDRTTLDFPTTFDDSFIEENRLAGFLVVMLSETERLRSVRLSKLADGMITFSSEKGVSVPIRFEAVNGTWTAICSHPFKLLNSRGAECYRVELHNRQLIPVVSKGVRRFLYVEQNDPKNLVFRNYLLGSSSEITIGRAADNDIVCNNKLVSSHHAKLVRTGDRWRVLDCKSTNGVFVNGIKTSSADLRLGDKVYIIGMQIIMGVNFISINNTESTSISSGKLSSLSSTRLLMRPTTLKVQRETCEAFYNRLPRRRIAFKPEKISIEPPPMSLSGNQIPLLLRMGGSMVMGGASALAGVYTTLISSVAFPIMTQKYTDKQRKEYEEKRVETYTHYLNNLRIRIRNEKNYEETVLNQNYPEINTLLSYPFSKKQLWERRNNDDDFLLLRIGHGNLSLIAEFEYPKRKFEMDDDELETEMYRIAESAVKIENVPVMTSIIDNYICGFSGNRKLLFSFIHRLIIQITMLHSYDEVKLLFVIGESELENISYVKYLPHTWDESRTIRFIATNTSEACRIGEYLRHAIEPDFKNSENRTMGDYLQSRPYFVVFAFDKHMLDSMEFIKELMQKNKNYGLSLLTVFEDMPKECSHVFNIQGVENNNLVFLKDIDHELDSFTIDHVNSELAHKSLSAISNISLKSSKESYALPKSVSFLEMFNVGKIEHLNPQKRWSESNPVQSLAAPIGVGTDGGLFYLDLHQKFQGPHGLVAGMTGSGKSEFLITYILSMAVNYHPDEVAFVLIDYKGGGLAGAFDNPTQGVHLPHLIGTITNLDGATIQRSVISIQSELLRRQRDFNTVKDLNNEGTMDIYTYQRLYRNGKVKKPMPHLFIISDEFAELKQQQPEFMDDLISIARIGRSLGVHLILATQKPSGVVNDQIRSNTKFRVCLKVQDRNDSTDMLKRPEAAEIRETGRFYLQVGYNEYFALGQSAWCGADYIPSDKVIVKKDDSVQFIDSIGSNIMEVKPPSTTDKSNGSQLTAIVKMLSDIADVQNIRPKQLWEDELPSVIDTKQLERDYPQTPSPEKLSVFLGKLDDPRNLRQFPLYFDLTHCQNLLIVGAPGSGKTYLVQSLIYSLLDSYPIEKFNFYALDYSSRIFKIFTSLPNCGGVLYDEDSDSLDKFFEIINKIVDDRKQLFTKLEVENYDAANAVEPIPPVFVIIDGLAELSNSKIGEKHFYRLGDYMRECAGYGVKYIITCGQLNDLSSRMRYSIGDCVTLNLKDKYAYGDALGCRVEYTPPKTPGRGLYKYDEAPLEIQTCMCLSELSDKERIAAMKQKIEEIKSKEFNGVYADKMPVISENATYEQFYSQFKRGRIPLGYSKKDAKPVAIPFKQLSALSVYLGNPAGKKPIIENFLFAADQEKMQKLIIRKNEDSLFFLSSEELKEKNMRVIEPAENVLDSFWRELVDIMNERKAVIEEYCAAHSLDSENPDSYNSYCKYLMANTEPVMLLIEDFTDFCSNVSLVGSLVYDKIFSIAKRRNIYVIAFFEPLDEASADSSMLLSTFNPDSNVLLLGGNFDKQRICESEILNKFELSAELPYNLGIMNYKRGFYPLLVPCGEIRAVEVDEDDRDIF